MEEEGLSLVNVALWYRNGGYNIYADQLSDTMRKLGLKPCHIDGDARYSVETVTAVLLERKLPREVLEKRVKD